MTTSPTTDIQPDYVMVPRALTPAMVAAWETACPEEGWNAIPEMNDADANAAIAGAEWAAMIAAAPASPIRTSVANEGEREALLDGEGWVYWNPDAGEEYASNHPVESGECCDAERIRKSTAQEDTLWQAMQQQFARAEALSPALDNTAVEGLYRQALEDVCNPLGYLQRRAEAEGSQLGGMAYAIANDLATVQGIARDALATVQTEKA